MDRYKDLTGQKFGRLTALHRLHNYHKKGTYWLCVCECGNLKEINIKDLRKGNTKSCGCLKRDKLLKFHKGLITHGKSNTRLYRIWKAMKQRCYKKYSNSYKYYGERGIKICDDWLNDNTTFFDWAMKNGYNDTLTIDRIDVNGNYSPDNCRWVTMEQQNKNRNNSKYFTINGVTHCLAEWCEIYKLKYTTVLDRLNKLNWTIEKALELTNGEEVKAC